MNKNPEIQFRSPEEIKAYQESRLAEELLYLQNHSRFYQRLFQAHHIDIQQIKTIEDLQQIPVTTKTDLQLHNEDFICVSRDEIIDYVTTSGTLGDPMQSLQPSLKTATSPRATIRIAPFSKRWIWAGIFFPSCPRAS